MAGEFLRIVSGKAAGTEVRLTEEFEIGRSAPGPGTLGEDEELSRRHARVFRDARGDLVLEDLGSTNGTFVNGRRLTERATLRPGDRIKAGRTTLQVLDAAGKAPQPTAFARSEGGTEPAAAPAPVVRRATPVAARAPATVDPFQTRPRSPTSPRRSRTGPILAGLVLAAVAAGVVVAVLTLGDDDPSTASSETQGGSLTAQQIARQGDRSTVQIDARGPQPAREVGAPAQASGGTGIVIDAAGGLVLTNEHVVAGNTSLKVRLPDGSDVTARIEGQAPCEDLALISLRPPPSGLTSARLGDSDGIRPGDTVTALGYPGAFESAAAERRLQVTSGSVTAPTGAGDLGPTFPRYQAFIQHQAPINPGNSGGPLFDSRGRVVGVNTFGSEENQGQFGAIAVNRVKSVLGALSSGNTDDYVGWRLLPWVATGVDVDGIAVLSVDAGSPADSAELRSGDRASLDGIGESPLVGATILELNNQPVNTIADVCDVLGSRRANAPLVVTADVVNTLRSSGGELFLPATAPSAATAIPLEIKF